MKSADQIQRLLRSAAVKTDGASDDAVFQNLKIAYTRVRETRSAPEAPAIWRTIMKSPRVKLTMAAVLLLLGASAVLFWQKTGAGIALADVAAKIEQVQSYSCQMNATLTRQGAEPTPILEGTLLMARDLGQKATIQFRNPFTGQTTLQEVYVLPSKKTFTILMPNEKKYSVEPITEGAAERSRNAYDPRYLIEGILKGEHTSLGRSTVDGIEVEGFQSTDPNSPGGGSQGKTTTSVWADAKTGFPVRMETDTEAVGGMHVLLVFHEFRWDPPVEASEIEPVIPPDYTPGKPQIEMHLKG